VHGAGRIDERDPVREVVDDRAIQSRRRAVAGTPCGKIGHRAASSVDARGR
jgi:hypothetical protein